MSFFGKPSTTSITQRTNTIIEDRKEKVGFSFVGQKSRSSVMTLDLFPISVHIFLVARHGVAMLMMMMRLRVAR